MRKTASVERLLVKKFYSIELFCLKQNFQFLIRKDDNNRLLFVYFSLAPLLKPFIVAMVLRLCGLLNATFTC